MKRNAQRGALTGPLALEVAAATLAKGPARGLESLLAVLAGLRGPSPSTLGA